MREDLLDGLRGFDRDGRFLYHDLVGNGNISDHASSALPVSQVRGLARSEAAGLGRGVDGDEDDVGLSDVFLDVGAEEEVFSAALFDDVVETWLVDGELVAVPGGDPWD